MVGCVFCGGVSCNCEERVDYERWRQYWDNLSDDEKAAESAAMTEYANGADD